MYVLIVSKVRIQLPFQESFISHVFAFRGCPDDIAGKFIQHRLFRDSCLAVEGNFLKDLTVLGREMSKIVLVDNSPHAFGYQIDNGIPIESWFDDPNDTELLKLAKFLDTLHSCQDVRTQVRKEFATYRKVRIAK
jgi:CTD small phosphatase-like protein 2